MGLFSKQGAEAFLGKVFVMGEHFGEPSLSHRLHGDTICQTIRFVRAGFIQGEPGQEGLMRLWDHVNLRVDKDPASERDGFGPELRVGGAQVGEDFNEHFLGGDDLSITQCLAEGQRAGVPVVFGIDKGDPGESIRKDCSHEERFGVP